MCIAAPSRVIEVRGETALTECFGERREVSLMLIGDDVAVGDYLLIRAGGFAFERIEPEAAEETLALMRELLASGGENAVRVLGTV